MRKRRTREHVIADLSANHIERLFLLAGHTAERVEADYGYDLFVQTFDADGALEPDFLLVQLKASDAPRVVSAGQEFALTLERRDLQAWQANRVPLFLIFYDAANDAAYWRETQDQAARDAAQAQSETITLRIATANRVDAAAVEQMRRMKNNVGGAGPRL